MFVDILQLRDEFGYHGLNNAISNERRISIDSPETDSAPDQRVTHKSEFDHAHDGLDRSLVEVLRNEFGIFREASNEGESCWIHGGLSGLLFDDLDEHLELKSRLVVDDGELATIADGGMFERESLRNSNLEVIVGGVYRKAKQFRVELFLVGVAVGEHVELELVLF